jgi:hypothetical protein
MWPCIEEQAPGCSRVLKAVKSLLVQEAAEVEPQRAEAERCAHETRPHLRCRQPPYPYPTPTHPPYPYPYPTPNNVVSSVLRT